MDLKSKEKMCTIIRNQYLTNNEIMMPYQQPLDHVTQILDRRENRILVKAYFLYKPVSINSFLQSTRTVGQE